MLRNNETGENGYLEGREERSTTSHNNLLV